MVCAPRPSWLFSFLQSGQARPTMSNQSRSCLASLGVITHLRELIAAWQLVAPPDPGGGFFGCSSLTGPASKQYECPPLQVTDRKAVFWRGRSYLGEGHRTTSAWLNDGATMDGIGSLLLRSVAALLVPIRRMKRYVSKRGCCTLNFAFHL